MSAAMIMSQHFDDSRSRGALIDAIKTHLKDSE